MLVTCSPTQGAAFSLLASGAAFCFFIFWSTPDYLAGLPFVFGREIEVVVLLAGGAGVGFGIDCV